MDDLPVQYLRGIELFNAGEFFASHEALEGIWLKSEGAERELLSALIQSAAALHHLQRGNLKGASSVYRRAQRKLAALPPTVMGLDTKAFAQELEDFFVSQPNSTAPLASLSQIRLNIQRTK
jgi:predicted metal-dependent hydrolase